MIAARQIFLGRGGGAKLQYDAEVEYLESTGTQWIDTGLNYFADFEIGIKLRASVPSRALGTSVSMCLRRYNENNPYWRLLVKGKGYQSSTSVVDYHVMSWKDGVFAADGATVHTVSNPFASGTMKLFGVGVSYSPNMIYACKLWDANGVLVRDFIPVRVGTEGAMYDRVSGQLFRNAGTGAFLYGGDVYSVPVETSQYVQDGLVAMWDGKENAGVGKHSPNTAQWTELVRGGRAAFPQSYLLDSNSFTFQCSSSNRMFLELPSVNGVRTIELVARALPDSNFANNPRWYSASPPGQRIEIDTTQSGTRTNLSYTKTDGNFYNRSIHVSSDATKAQYSAVMLDAGSASLTVDGNTSVATVAPNSAFISGAMTMELGTYSISYMHEQVYALRCYDRVLTSDEIAANYAVDKARFNLP